MNVSKAFDKYIFLLTGKHSFCSTKELLRNLATGIVSLTLFFLLIAIFG